MEVGLEPLSPDWAEIGYYVVLSTVMLTVAFASFRRARCLSRFPIWKALLTAVFAGLFWEIWLLVSVVNRTRIASEGEQYRRERIRRPAPA